MNRQKRGHCVSIVVDNTDIESVLLLTTLIPGKLFYFGKSNKLNDKSNTKLNFVKSGIGWMMCSAVQRLEWEWIYFTSWFTRGFLRIWLTDFLLKAWRRFFTQNINTWAVTIWYFFKWRVHIVVDTVSTSRWLRGHSLK